MENCVIIFVEEGDVLDTESVDEIPVLDTVNACDVGDTAGGVINGVID